MHIRTHYIRNTHTYIHVLAAVAVHAPVLFMNPHLFPLHVYVLYCVVLLSRHVAECGCCFYIAL